MTARKQLNDKSLPRPLLSSLTFHKFKSKRKEYCTPQFRELDDNQHYSCAMREETADYMTSIHN